MTHTERTVIESALRLLPKPPLPIIEWCQQNARLIGSARSTAYSPEITPWCIAPLQCAEGGKSRIRMTFIKPIQAGGSDVGELAIYYWLGTKYSGDIFYYWQNDEKASERWTTRIERRLLACEKIINRISTRGVDGIPELRRAGVWTKGQVQFPHCNFVMLGVNTNRNVASESVRFEVNEEIHDAESGWSPGKLEQAYGRTTAYRNAVIFNISNAGYDGDQLHTAFINGTMQQWQVRCPGCGQFHIMRTRWEDDRPDLGGLRYDADGCRLDSGDINYQKLLPTIRFQMPCGAIVRDTNSERRALSLSGKYSDPANPGALATERSYTLEAVAVDYIPWVTLIQQKHLALRALRNGDAKPWFDYLRERECQFIKPDDRPVVNRVILSDSKKDRAGLPNRMGRFGALDRQKGSISKGEMPHWWAVIQDIAIEKIKASDKLAKQLDIAPGTEIEIIHVLTVFEGKILTDADAAGVMTRHEVKPGCVVVDSGWGEDTVNVYHFCLQHGFNAIKGEDNAKFGGHGDKIDRIFSPERPLHLMLNQPRTRQNIMEEPQYWLYSKSGIMNRLAWLRSSPVVNYEVPGDVSKDFIEHMDSWTLDEQRKQSGSLQVVHVWKQHKTRDDLYFCACYCAMLFEMAGFIGANIEQKKP